jgi:hypothetical protein
MTISGITLNGGTVKLALFADEHNSIEGIHATDVAFEGPAVVAFIGTTHFEDISFLTDDINSLLWDFDPARSFAAGAIGISNGTFIRCTFRGIGVTGDAAHLNQLLQTLTFTPKA